jgi:hypothetical protein
LQFQDKVKKGEAKLGEKKVDIVPPDPLGNLGSGWEKMAAERIKTGEKPIGLTVGATR